MTGQTREDLESYREDQERLIHDARQIGCEVARELRPGIGFPVTRGSSPYGPGEPERVVACTKCGHAMRRGNWEGNLGWCEVCWPAKGGKRI